ncbi:hypothetical protein [Thiothrix sp.]|uniref:hypothetical protein n=1 Tax=Thiothrix sp. TaxID=1032 RepID=UPI0025798925|nr:hypothetical protein [Thiothrix sp.]
MKVEQITAIRLAEIGVSEEDVHFALEQGVVEGFYTATQTHPRNTAAIRLWQEIVKALRDRLLLKGWLIPNHSEDVYSEINSSDGQWRLLVWTGDRYTGIMENGKKPKSKNGKGGGVSALIHINSELPLNNPNKKSDLNVRKTIALLFFYDKQSNEIRAELSLPVGMEYEYTKSEPHKKPRATKFDWRVLFSPLNINIDIPVHNKDIASTEFTDDIDIHIDFK